MYYRKYESENLYLSPMLATDYKTYTKWLNDETLASCIGRFNMNITEEYEQQFIEKCNQKAKLAFSVIRKSDDVLIGHCGLEEKDEISHRYVVGGYIGEKEERGKGYGTEMLKLITRYAF